MTALRKSVFGTVLIAGACIVLWAWALGKPEPAIRMRVRGFATNRYVFPNDADPDFIYATIEVTNRSRQRFFTYQALWRDLAIPNIPGFWDQAPKPVPPFFAPRSGFSFDVLVWRNTTNQIIVPFVNVEPIWPVRYLPDSVLQKLPKYLVYRTKPEVQIVTQAVSWGSAMQSSKSSQ